MDQIFHPHICHKHLYLSVYTPMIDFYDTLYMKTKFNLNNKSVVQEPQH